MPEHEEDEKMKMRSCESILDAAERGGIVDILTASAALSEIPGTGGGSMFASNFFSKIQSNASLVMEACTKGYPVDSYMDVVLSLSLQVSLHSYSKLSPEANSGMRLVPLKNFLESFMNSVSRFRGNSHLHLVGPTLKKLLPELHPEGLTFSIGLEPNTPGEREGLRRLVHRVRVVRECVRTEVAGLADAERPLETNAAFQPQPAPAAPKGGVFRFTPLKNGRGSGQVVPGTISMD